MSAFFLKSDNLTAFWLVRPPLLFPRRLYPKFFPVCVTLLPSLINLPAHSREFDVDMAWLTGRSAQSPSARARALVISRFLCPESRYTNLAAPPVWNKNIVKSFLFHIIERKYSEICYLSTWFNLYFSMFSK